MNSELVKLNSLIDWYETLQNDNELLLNKPLDEGKFSVKEIIAHLYRWDEYLITIGIPSIIENGTIDFPDFNEFNRESANIVANKGIEEVIKFAIQTRKKLVQLFIENEQIAQKPIRMNGQSQNPHSEHPFTFYYLIEDFSEHALHHKKQIEEFLQIQNSHSSI